MLPSRIALAALLAATALPVSAQTCAPFTDVPASDPFCANIQWIFNRGVTLGCATNQYCPANFVRRDQMAAFMNRLGDIVQARVTGTCAVGSYVRAIAADGTVTCGTDASGPANAYVQGGNVVAGDGILGTTSGGSALNLLAGGLRTQRLEGTAISPNLIGGFAGNSVAGGVRGATIGGGGAAPGSDPDVGSEGPNLVTSRYATIGGGNDNVAGVGSAATIAGGWHNTASGAASAIGGGSTNTTSGTDSTVAGGHNNNSLGNQTTIGGGTGNIAVGLYSTIAGGRVNEATGESSAVGGGQGNEASGNFSAVPGGVNNRAQGAGSMAGGSNADADQFGCFVWGDVSTSNFVSCGGGNRFVVRALGGFYFYTSGDSPSTYAGLRLFNGSGGWVAASDRALKEHVRPADGRQILEGVIAMPVTTWNYRAQEPSIRHIGPAAQDFHAAFGLGETETGINSVDADGVALAAIQGLNAKLEAYLAERDAEIAALRAEVASLRDLRREMFELRTMMSVEQRIAAAH